ncbi:MAG: hypothetical protein ETSY1_16475 [Candidatus Entotheonella factor]|uniref:Uncharacterized protein n=1 Tax=Entotheonella factor TaxID=1429438 RepID=W4LLQ2_ENTF1|nr:MAG: hypothetical protein ETSY1_16475 [Candidatus Entotheonella factor]
MLHQVQYAERQIINPMRTEQTTTSMRELRIQHIQMGASQPHNERGGASPVRRAPVLASYHDLFMNCLAILQNNLADHTLDDMSISVKGKDRRTLRDIGNTTRTTRGLTMNTKTSATDPLPEVQLLVPTIGVRRNPVVRER